MNGSLMDISILNVVEGLTALLIVVLGWNVKTLFNRLIKHEDKHDQMAAETNQLRIDMYKHQDKSTDKLREEINQLSQSLRIEITNASSTNTQILLSAIEGIKK